MTNNDADVAQVVEAVSTGATRVEGAAGEEKGRLQAVTVAIIDDGIVPPTIADTGDQEEAARILTRSDDLDDDLAQVGAERTEDPVANLSALLGGQRQTPTLSALAGLSQTFDAKLQDHLFFLRLKADLERLAGEVVPVNPFGELPDLITCDVVFLDYYLEGPSGGADRAEAIAREVADRNDAGRARQVILMSNREGVADERRAFRKKSDLTGASFAFVPKSELATDWMVYCHLAMMERARPIAPSIEEYKNILAEAVQRGGDQFLELIQDLDIDDYAHLQTVALMQDGDPLGEYIATLFASELVSRTIEADDVRTAERKLDRAEFEARPFASSEPSTIVKSLFHSALMSSNVGELADHPRAASGGLYSGLPLVRMGDVFFTKEKDRAICIVSADCHLAFAPNEERPPDPETSVLLVSGPTQQITTANASRDLVTEGLLEGGEVYRIQWKFAAYQSVPLSGLRDYLVSNGFVIERRDRLRAPFSFALQQSFGANLFRVGTPGLPPITKEVGARMLLVHHGKIIENRLLDNPKLRLSWYRKKKRVRLSLSHVEELRQLCLERRAKIEDELNTLAADLDDLEERRRKGTEEKIDKHNASVSDISQKLADPAFWEELHGDHPVSDKLSELKGVARLVQGEKWNRDLPYTIVLQVDA